MAISPAHPIGATAEQLQALGEICAIQGYIELEMVIAIARLLDSNMNLAQSVLGRLGLVNKAELWLRFIEEKCKD
jgi:hypothetical protein